MPLIPNSRVQVREGASSAHLRKPREEGRANSEHPKLEFKTNHICLTVQFQVQKLRAVISPDGGGRHALTLYLSELALKLKSAHLPFPGEAFRA